VFRSNASSPSRRVALLWYVSNGGQEGLFQPGRAHEQLDPREWTARAVAHPKRPGRTEGITRRSMFGRCDVARNLPPASLESCQKLQFLPGFQQFREVFAELPGQRTEVISLPGSPRRASAPARATALSDWLFCLGLPRRCAGETAVIYHNSLLQTGNTRSGKESPERWSSVMRPIHSPTQSHIRGRLEGVCATIDAPSQHTHTASIQDSSTPVPWRWRSRGARNKGVTSADAPNHVLDAPVFRTSAR